MQKLIAELQRLYFHETQLASGQKIDQGEPAACASSRTPLLGLSPELLAESLRGECSLAIELLSTAQSVRAMVLSLEHVSDWESVGEIFHGVQHDLDLPAPAISVSGHKGYSVWFSLADLLPVAEAKSFLTALCEQYLPDISETKIALYPGDSISLVSLVPAFQPTSGKWSAFIDPNMGSMFLDEPGLEMAPNMDRQAEMLTGLRPIKAIEFQRAMARLLTLRADQAGQIETRAKLPAAFHQGLSVEQNYQDPKSFLLAVMNDPTVSIEQRIEAAKALLV